MESKQLHLDGAELIVPPNGKNSDLRALISGKFRFFFSLDKSKTGPEDLLDSDQDGVPDFVTAHLVNLVQAHRVFTEEAGLPDFFSEGRFAAHHPTLKLGRPHAVNLESTSARRCSL